MLVMHFLERLVRRRRPLPRSAVPSHAALSLMSGLMGSSALLGFWFYFVIHCKNSNSWVFHSREEELERPTLPGLRWAASRAAIPARLPASPPEQP